MLRRKRLIIIGICLLVLAGVALLGGILGKKTAKIGRERGEETALRCSYDGTKLTSVYQVDAFLHDGTTRSFCSIYCATRWFQDNKNKVIYFTVVDEVTGQKFDSTLGYFVESEVVTVPEVKNRIHSFSSKEDALKHARQFNGRLIENPFGPAFLIPEEARFDSLRVGVQSLLDALPLRLAIFKPIFKENRLKVEIVPFHGNGRDNSFMSEGPIDAVICDLPTAIILTNRGSVAQIIRNVMRSNIYRPMFAVVASPKLRLRDLADMERQTMAIPKGVSFQFYTEYFFRRDDVSYDNVILKEVEDVSKAWDLIYGGKVSAAILRTPYTEAARSKGLTFLADDRTLPWMSVLLFSQSAIKSKTDAIRRFLFSFEQSVMALNLQSEKYHVFLREKGGVPPEVREKFPMPFFDTANAPSELEMEPVIGWLVEKDLINQDVTYKRLVNTQFLPNPKEVGLAFCCR